MNFERSGIAFSVSDQVIEQLVLEKLSGVNGAAKVATIAPGTLPRIGAEVVELGGIFAGVARGLAGESDYYLIVGPEASGKLEWQKAIDWADGITQHGFADFELPRRTEQALLYANVPELFQKEWYWSQEQPAVSSNTAWVQYFTDGYQHWDGKGHYYRARAVRSVPIQ